MSSSHFESGRPRRGSSKWKAPQKQSVSEAEGDEKKLFMDGTDPLTKLSYSEVVDVEVSQESIETLTNPDLE